MRARAVLLMSLCAATARAADPPASAPAPEPPAAPDAESGKPAEPKSHFTLAFAGGALVPRGAMESGTGPGLDVWGRIGWVTASGLGLVMHLEYAPLRRDPAGPAEVVDAHLFAATAGPRLTIGRDLVRLWLSGSAGVVVERVQTTTANLPSQVLVESALGVSGGGGLDLCFFSAGGITIAAAYTRGLSTGATQEYVSLNAGLVFVY